MAARPDDNRISIELAPEEALVLFEFLHRFTEREQLAIEDQAEERVLWNLLAELETRLVEPFKGDYAELLDAARVRVRDRT